MNAFYHIVVISTMTHHTSSEQRDLLFQVHIPIFPISSNALDIECSLFRSPLESQLLPPFEQGEGNANHISNRKELLVFADLCLIRDWSSTNELSCTVPSRAVLNTKKPQQQINKHHNKKEIVGKFFKGIVSLAQ